MDNTNNPPSSKKSKKHSQPANTSNLFQAIQELRIGFGLTPLQNMLNWKQNLNVLLNEKTPKDILDQIPYVVLSKMYFIDNFQNETIYHLFDRWLKDPGKRAILFAPGNYPYISIEQNKIHVIIFLILQNS